MMSLRGEELGGDPEAGRVGIGSIQNFHREFGGMQESILGGGVGCAVIGHEMRDFTEKTS
jgi:hypothetical protein